MISSPFPMQSKRRAVFLKSIARVISPFAASNYGDKYERTNAAAQQPQAPQQSQQPQQSPRDWWFTAHRRFSTIGSALAIMMVFWIGLNILATEALRTLLGTDVPAWAVLLASSGPLYVVAHAAEYVGLHSRTGYSHPARYPHEGGEFIQIFVMCIPVMFLGNMIGNILSAGATDGQATNRINDVILGSDWRMNALFIGLLAPVCEEWIFAREIISTCAGTERPQSCSPHWHFALFHMNVFQFFYAFGLGLMFGYVYTRTSRLRYSVAMHADQPERVSTRPIGDTTGSIPASSTARSAGPKSCVWLETGNMGGMGIMMLYGTVMLAPAFAGIVLLITKRKSWEFYLAPEELPAGLKIRTAYTNPALSAYLLLTVMLTGWMLFA